MRSWGRALLAIPAALDVAAAVIRFAKGDHARLSDDEAEAAAFRARATLDAALSAARRGKAR